MITVIYQNYVRKAIVFTKYGIEAVLLSCVFIELFNLIKILRNHLADVCNSIIKQKNLMVKYTQIRFLFNFGKCLY